MNRRQFLHRSGAAVSLGLLARGALLAQNPPAGPVSASPAPPPTAFKELRRQVGYFTGRGGTIGWLASPDALAAVDTQFPDTATVFLRDLPGRSGRRLDVVINTHHHPDHTGGNAVMHPATKAIVAHVNVPELLRARAEADKRTLDPATLPDATFPETWRMDLGEIGRAHV